VRPPAWKNPSVPAVVQQIGAFQSQWGLSSF
jgi:hypothetical protein